MGQKNKSINNLKIIDKIRPRINTLKKKYTSFALVFWIKVRLIKPQFTVTAVSVLSSSTGMELKGDS